jgi:glutamate carboxypeptidase
LVAQETPSADKPALDAFGRRLADHFTTLGAEVACRPHPQRGDHWRLRLTPGADPSARPALLLCHFDTVWPVGTLARRPWRLSDGRAYGPGAFDMKASFVLIEFALRALAQLGHPPARPVIALFTSDEEIGSPSSRPLIEAEAGLAAYALVLESPLAGGRLKTARKGVGRFSLTLTGRAAHAGIEPEQGISAIVELAHQILAISALAEPAVGTTINVGVVEGGSTPNVVPANANARIDVRVTTLAEAARIQAAMAGLTPRLTGAGLTVAGGFSRPPMERTPAITALFERARQLAVGLGQSLTEGATGGASDGNFTAALGLPTLDGLGALGAGAHAEEEHVLVASLPERAALLALLLLEL